MVRIEINEGRDWIEIHDGRRPWSDIKRIQSAGVQMQRVGTDLVSTGIDTLEHSITVITSALIDWSITDSKGNKIPPTREGLQHREFYLGDEVEQAIEDYYEAQARPADEGKGSPGSSQPESDPGDGIARLHTS